MELNQASVQQMIRDLQALEDTALPPPAPPPLPPGRTGGSYEPMEPRIAKLEAQMEHVRAELGKLATLPSDMAGVRERLSHLSTREDVKSALETVTVDVATLRERVSHLPTKEELGSKLRTYLTTAGIIVTIANVAITWGPKLFAH